MSTKNGTVLAGLTPPWARDAVGVELFTRFQKVDHNTFVQVVKHRGVAEYPVLADPWWVIPVAIRGGQVIARQVVNKGTRQAAMMAAKRQIARQQNYDIDRLVAEAGRTLKSLTRRNFRENVRRRVGWSKETLKPYDVHHTLPVEFEPFFKEAGLNIHNPIFGHPWCRSAHRSYARRFNADWRRFTDHYEERVEDTPTARRIIEDYRIDMVSKYANTNSYQCANGRAAAEWKFAVE